MFYCPSCKELNDERLVGVVKGIPSDLDPLGMHETYVCNKCKKKIEYMHETTTEYRHAAKQVHCCMCRHSDGDIIMVNLDFLRNGNIHRFEQEDSNGNVYEVKMTGIRHSDLPRVLLTCRRFPPRDGKHVEVDGMDHCGEFDRSEVKTRAFAKDAVEKYLEWKKKGASDENSVR